MGYYDETVSYYGKQTTRVLSVTRDPYNGDRVISSGGKQLHIVKQSPAATAEVYGDYVVSGDIELVQEVVGPLRGFLDLIDMVKKNQI